jgi:xylose dehydrogenase (NAD/NADP)
VRWGFIGAGGIARDSLAPAVHAARGAQLRAVSSRSRERAAALGSEVVVHSDYEALVDDSTVDIVYISLHNSAHEEWVVRSLSAGKHVVCEKPLGRNAHEVARMVDAARQTGRLLVEACWNQWHPRTRELKRILRGGDLGEIHFAHSSFHGVRPGPGNYRNDPALGGGALYDVGCYAVAGALIACGGELPLSVTAKWELTEGGVDEVTRAVLEFHSGSAVIEAGLTGGADEKLVVTGADEEVELTHPAFTATRSASLVRRSAGTERIMIFPPVDPYRLMVEEISAAARGEDAYVVDVEHSLLVARVMDLVRIAASK